MSKRTASALAASLLFLGAVGCGKSSHHDPSDPGGDVATCAAAPAAPTALASTSRTATTVALTWTAPAAPADCTISGYARLDDGVQGGTSTTTAVTLQGLASNRAHSFTVTAADEAGASAPSAAVQVVTLPDFGPNTRIYDPAMAMADIQADINAVYAPQFSDKTGQFNTNRYALLFKPGAYQLKVPVGYYMQVLGLGTLPDDTTITGVVTSYGHWSGDWGGSGWNATQNFWRGLENLSVVPTNDTDPLPQAPTDPAPEGTPNTLGAGGLPYMRWAVSQACPFRRMHVQGDLALNHWSGWSSGGWMSDSKVDGEVGSGSQQQWITRSSSIGSWSNVNWNMVFLGVDHPYVDAQAKGWVYVRTTSFDTVPAVREKPFLHADANGDYFVLVPSLRRNTTGTTWASGPTAGTDLPITDFFVARPGDAVEDVNAALAAGKHLLLTPGIYHLDGTIEVTQPDTVVLGLGMATLHPDTGLPAMTIADVDGVTLAGVLFDAGTQTSPVLLQVGPEGASADHSANPTLLADVFVRVGGAEDGRADVGVIINSDDVIGDHFWIWRADHGTAEAPTGWTLNPSRNGIVVNGDDVTIYGLFVEHFEEYQTIWNGERGRVYFYQSEIPYDVPDQPSWMSHDGAKNGFASYKVADTVTDHEAWGLGVYSVFNVFPGVLDSSIEVPDVAGVKMHHMVNYGLAQGTITHVINEAGGPAVAGLWNPISGAPVVEYPVPTPPPPPPAPEGLAFPLDFEPTGPNATYELVAFGDGAVSLIVDSADPDNHVAHFTKSAAAASWAGFTVLREQSSNTGLEVDPLDTTMHFTLRVRCDTSAVTVLLKLEELDGSPSVELRAVTGADTAGTWQTLSYDFTSTSPDAAADYLKLSVFPGFDAQAATACDVDDVDDVIVVPQ